MALTWTSAERAELERRVRSLKIRAADARRARVVLTLADGASYSTIETAVPCYRDYSNRWRRRFLAGRGEGLRAHTSAAFVEFLGDIVTSHPKGRAIHVIAENLATH